jgi:hypothetical protein
MFGWVPKRVSVPDSSNLITGEDPLPFQNNQQISDLRSIVAIDLDKKVLTQVQAGFEQVPGQIQDFDTDEKGIISEVSEDSQYGSGVNHC